MDIETKTTMITTSTDVVSVDDVKSSLVIPSDTVVAAMRRKSKDALMAKLALRQKWDDDCLAAVGKRITAILEHTKCTSVDDCGGFWIIDHSNKYLTTNESNNNLYPVDIIMWRRVILINYGKILTKRHKELKYELIQGWEGNTVDSADSVKISF
jgi:hypothetical protein